MGKRNKVFLTKPTLWYVQLIKYKFKPNPTQWNVYWSCKQLNSLIIFWCSTSFFLTFFRLPPFIWLGWCNQCNLAWFIWWNDFKQLYENKFPYSDDPFGPVQFLPFYVAPKVFNLKRNNYHVKVDLHENYVAVSIRLVLWLVWNHRLKNMFYFVQINRDYTVK